jgi:predicted DNA-binding transcriptional regulator AlpA
MSALPDWPRLMSADLAASYLSISKTTFLQRVGARAFPQPIREGKRVLWDRRRLDLFVDARSGLQQSPANQPGDEPWEKYF